MSAITTHIFEVLDLLSDEQKEQIKNNDRDYIVFDVQCTNAGAWVDLDCTNDFPEEKFSNGECTIFDNDDIEDIIDRYEEQTGKRF